VHRRVVRCVLRTHRRILRATAAAALVLSLTACATAAAGAWTLPNASSTPGAIASSDPVVVCQYGYASAHRNVPYAVRDRVYLEYGIPRGHRKGLRIEHLVPLEIGGANDERNLWPQPLAESKRKDEVENGLRVAVCVRHTIPLAAAQAAIARNWTTTPVGLPAVREHHYPEDER
jgi:hypothetical protein